MKKLWLLWSGIAFCCALSAHILATSKAPLLLPLPSHIQQVQIIRSNDTLTLKYHQSHWQINGKPAHRFQSWLEQLRHACWQKIPQQNLPPEAFNHLITLELDHDRWQFGTHNRYAKAHYLHHGKDSYLCNEQIKPRLNLPATYWSTPDA